MSEDRFTLATRTCRILVVLRAQNGATGGADPPGGPGGSAATTAHPSGAPSAHTSFRLDRRRPRRGLGECRRWRPMTAPAVSRRSLNRDLFGVPEKGNDYLGDPC